MPGTGWLNAREMDAWRSFLHASIRVLDMLDTELVRSHQLTLADYELLSELSEQPEGRLRMAELAARALVSKTRLSYRVDRLEERRLIIRSSDPTDGRGTFACLTAAGRRLVIQVAPTHVAGVRRHLLDPLGAREQACIARALKAVLAQLDEAAESQKGPAEEPDHHRRVAPS